MPRKKITEEDLNLILDEPFNQSQVALFHKKIYNLTKEGLTIMEAIVEYCDMNGYEVDEIVSIIDPRMVQDIAKEALELNQLKKEYRTPVIEFA